MRYYKSIIIVTEKTKLDSGQSFTTPIEYKHLIEAESMQEALKIFDTEVPKPKWVDVNYYVKYETSLCEIDDIEGQKWKESLHRFDAFV